MTGYSVTNGTGMDIGEEVALLANEVLGPGTYERERKGSTLATGVYWSRLQVGPLSETRKIIHVR